MSYYDSFTTTDHHDRRYLVVPVALVREDAAADVSDSGRWCAHVCDPGSPLVDLYAFADSRDAVCRVVAATAWSAVLAGELSPWSARSLSGVYVVSTSCDVFDADTLTAAAAHGAA